MTTCLILYKYTEQGIKNIKEPATRTQHALTSTRRPSPPTTSASALRTASALLPRRSRRRFEWEPGVDLGRKAHRHRPDVTLLAMFKPKAVAAISSFASVMAAKAYSPCTQRTSLIVTPASFAAFFSASTRFGAPLLLGLRIPRCLIAIRKRTAAGVTRRGV
jgi:hypothetical protein